MSDILSATFQQGATFLTANTVAAGLAHVHAPPQRGSRFALAGGALAANAFAFNGSIWSGGRDAHLYYLSMATASGISAGIFSLHAWRATTATGAAMAGGWAAVCACLAGPLYWNAYRTAQ